MENELRQLVGDLVMQVAALRAQLQEVTKENEALRGLLPEGADITKPGHPGN